MTTTNTNAGELIVEVKDVTLRFGGIRSLDGVSLSQKRGEILAVIGPNGAGKTSLFNCLTGVYQPQDGTIFFYGHDGARTSVLGRKPSTVNHVGIARTFQTSRLFNALTAFENVKVGVESRQRTGPIGAILHLPRTRREEREGDDRTADLLEFVGLREKGNEIAGSLPFGDRRRLEIARALGTSPEILLLDEPAAGTNPVEKAELSALIERIRSERQVSVMLIEHDMRLVMGLAERIVVLNFGAVIAEGTPVQVQSNPSVIEAYLGKAAAESAPARGDEPEEESR